MNVKCSHCGTINKLGHHSFDAIPICGRCKAGLPEPLLHPTLRLLRRAKFSLLLAVAVVLSILGWSNIHPGLNRLKGYNSAPDAVTRSAQPVASPFKDQTTETAVAEAPLPLPPTGAGRNLSSVSGRHWIDVSAVDNTLVRVYWADTNKLTAERFIRSGDHWQIKLPTGTFVVRTATGAQWYGPTLLFGSDTSFSEAMSTFDLSDEGSYYQLQLVPTRDGNLRTIPIGQDKF